jgi:hypothetical protein
MKNVPHDAVSENNQLLVAHLLHVTALQRNLEANIFGFELPEVPSKCNTRRDSHT